MNSSRRAKSDQDKMVLIVYALLIEEILSRNNLYPSPDSVPLYQGTYEAYGRVYPLQSIRVATNMLMANDGGDILTNFIGFTAHVLPNGATGYQFESYLTIIPADPLSAVVLPEDDAFWEFLETYEIDGKAIKAVFDCSFFNKVIMSKLTVANSWSTETAKNILRPLIVQLLDEHQVFYRINALTMGEPHGPWDEIRLVDSSDPPLDNSHGLSDT